MYQNDGREHSGVAWRAEEHALNMVRALYWSCDCWEKPQKDFWTVQICIQHSDKCYKCDKTVLIVTQTVLSGRAKMCPRYPPQQRHFQLLKTFTGEQHLITAPANKNISTEETWSWIPDSRKEKILHPKKENVQFCSVLHVQALGKREVNEILLFKSLQTQLRN